MSVEEDGSQRKTGRFILKHFKIFVTMMMMMMVVELMKLVFLYNNIIQKGAFESTCSGESDHLLNPQIFIN